MSYYILIGKNPVKVDGLNGWGWWMQSHSNMGSKHIANVRIAARKPFKKGHPNMLRRINRSRAEPLHISTVFLGLDHNFWGGGKPIVFETMILGGQHDNYQTHYCDWDDAAQGYKFALELATERLVL